MTSRPDVNVTALEVGTPRAWSDGGERRSSFSAQTHQRPVGNLRGLRPEGLNPPHFSWLSPAVPVTRGAGEGDVGGPDHPVAPLPGPHPEEPRRRRTFLREGLVFFGGPLR